MTIKPCIMKAGDLILNEDVKYLTSEQWDKFREYLRGCGYNIDDDLGTKYDTLDKSVLSDYAQYAVMDADGDLFWKDYDPDSKGIRITKDQILSTINEVPEMKSNTCIMQPGDYVTIATVERLKTSEWHAFRDYLKRYGHNIDPTFGLKRRPRFSTSTLIVLDTEGDLAWYDTSNATGKEITFDQILSVIDVSIEHIEERMDFHKQEYEKFSTMFLKRHHTIGVALELIATALKTPNTTVKIHDTNMCSLINTLLSDLKLSVLKLDYDLMCLSYSTT